MKKFITIFLVGLLVFSGVGAIAEIQEKKENIISESFYFSQPDIIEKEEYISIQLKESTNFLIKEDKPMIPIVTKLYTFPLGTRIDDVKVTFSNTVENKIEKLVMVSPEMKIFSTEHIIKNDYKTKREVDYSDIEIYPESRFDYRAAAGLKDEERVIYLTVSLKPVQYKPQEDIILCSEKATVEIIYTPPAEPVVFPEVYDLLIITPSQFKSALQRLADHKNNLDPPVKTVITTLNEIPSGVGVDTQEDIKYYIKTAIETWGIEYVILVGAGVKENEIFPVRKAWIGSPPHEDYFPSDLYFADIYNSTMGFSDWDSDEDGKFAEYPRDKFDVDILPDVYLGKIPCNDVDELNIVIDKIIFYKEHNKMTKKILQIGADSAPGSGVYEGEYTQTKVMENLSGYTPIRLWGTNGQLTKQNVGDGFRKGVDLVDFSGHGSYVSWATHPPDDDSVWIPPPTLISKRGGFTYIDIYLYGLKNAKKYPVVVFTACSNNKYTEFDRCIGWEMLSKDGGGSIATFAESGIGHGPTGPTFITKGIGFMEVTIFNELVNTKILGKVWNNCIAAYFAEQDPGLDEEDYKTMLEFSMFGDPTVVMQDGDDPVSRDINKPISGNHFDMLIEHIPILARLFKLIIDRL
jgi:hypothetical protein